MIYCQAEDKPIPRTEIVKGYEYEKDHYVVIEDEEIKKVAPKTAKSWRFRNSSRPTMSIPCISKVLTTWRPRMAARSLTPCF